MKQPSHARLQANLEFCVCVPPFIGALVNFKSQANRWWGSAHRKLWSICWANDSRGNSTMQWCALCTLEVVASSFNLGAVYVVCSHWQTKASSLLDVSISLSVTLFTMPITWEGVWEVSVNQPGDLAEQSAGHRLPLLDRIPLLCLLKSKYVACTCLR